MRISDWSSDVCSSDLVLQIHSDLGLGKRRARVLETMRDVNLPEPETLYHAYPHQLSGGQRQRIMIAMALTLEPALLFAAGPTPELDLTQQTQMLPPTKDIPNRTNAGEGTSVC